MYQSGRAGDEAKSVSLSPKTGELASLQVTGSHEEVAIVIYAINSPGLSGSLPDTALISLSTIQVIKFPR